MLPTETELGTSMLVSRTAVREALMLLREDGLIRDGEPVAHLQENISAQPVSFAGSAAAPLDIKDDGGTTLLTALNKAAGRGIGPGGCRSA
ncbi:MAG TPA: GntR family transcriptional regulator [Arthrobacter sp.]|uniref:GntR family transcriptional regulator n=1 Tax=Arthrobacter sp. TaxID=1667 RepID=UPI002F3F6596